MVGLTIPTRRPLLLSKWLLPLALELLMLSLSLLTVHKRPEVALPLLNRHCRFIAVAAVFYSSNATLMERRVVPSHTKNTSSFYITIKRCGVAGTNHMKKGEI